jgi:hypothetical protein
MSRRSTVCCQSVPTIGFRNHHLSQTLSQRLTRNCHLTLSLTIWGVRTHEARVKARVISEAWIQVKSPRKPRLAKEPVQAAPIPFGRTTGPFGTDQNTPCTGALPLIFGGWREIGHELRQQLRSNARTRHANDLNGAGNKVLLDDYNFAWAHRAAWFGSLAVNRDIAAPARVRRQRTSLKEPHRPEPLVESRERLDGGRIRRRGCSHSLFRRIQITTRLVRRTFSPARIPSGANRRSTLFHGAEDR